MHSQVHVLHVTKYDFEDQKTGRKIRGCKVSYLGDKQEEPNAKGLPVCTVTAPIELWDRFGQLPANYNVEFFQKPVGKKVELAIKEASFAPKA
jgi:hypothetical protein